MDLISRQEAIDAVKEEEYPCESDYDEGYMAALDKAVWIIEKWLPSAQSEIIYCKDCTRYEKKNGRCNLVEGLNVATANSFCSYAERRQKNG